MNIIFKEINDNQKIVIAAVDETVDDLFEKTATDLTEKELINYKQIKNENRKKEWLGIRLLLKQTLKKYIEIKYNSSGNPDIDGDYYISITHSKNIIGLNLSKHKTVGIDAEIISPKIIRTAHKFITEEEIKQFDEKEKLKKIYLNWCAKETLYKMKQHGGFDFKKNFKIYDADLYSKGTIKTQILINNTIEEHFLSYRFINYHDEEILIIWY